jgi:hypothetical protein
MHTELTVYTFQHTQKPSQNHKLCGTSDQYCVHFILKQFRKKEEKEVYDEHENSKCPPKCRMNSPTGTKAKM